MKTLHIIYEPLQLLFSCHRNGNAKLAVIQFVGPPVKFYLLGGQGQPGLRLQLNNRLNFFLFFHGRYSCAIEDCSGRVKTDHNLPVAIRIRQRRLLYRQAALRYELFPVCLISIAAPGPADFEESILFDKLNSLESIIILYNGNCRF